MISHYLLYTLFKVARHEKPQEYEIQFSHLVE